ncbi:unnamed protein product [Soboliphyme baturini]|uniref:Cadherin domain-containing protein n=1 Tax=Soboliphyme baturini TaxID=241478 RepID=A0A183J9H8_9BILA|nr:unnamed protein product [Soboliphyme baturini]
MASPRSVVVVLAVLMVFDPSDVITGLRPVSAYREVCQVNRHLVKPPTYEILDIARSGTVVFAASYWPRDAVVKPGGISGLAADFLRNSFTYDLPNNGLVRLVTNGTVRLPPYPSQLTETYLTIDILCNGNMHALAILKVTSTNRHAPRFLGLPYTLIIPEDTAVNSMIRTPVICVDWDPAPAYGVTFDLQVRSDHTFRLEVPWDEHYTPSQLRTWTGIRAEEWKNSSLPKVVYLRLLKELDFEYSRRSYTLYITAKDSIFNPFNVKSTTTDLLVKVADVDDTPPAFSSMTYKADISQVQKYNQINLIIMA